MMEDGYVDVNALVSNYEYTEAPQEDFDDELIYNPMENEDD